VFPPTFNRQRRALPNYAFGQARIYLTFGACAVVSKHAWMTNDTAEELYIKDVALVELYKV